MFKTYAILEDVLINVIQWLYSSGVWQGI